MQAVRPGLPRAAPARGPRAPLPAPPAPPGRRRGRRGGDAAARRYEFQLNYTFTNKKDEKLDKAPGSIDGQPFDMADCEGCELVVTDNCDQSQVDCLKNCKVFLGASSEAVFVRNCSDCTFYLACKQLRTRECTNCTFYLYAQTEPIIEMSTGMKFAPFLGGYPEQAAHMAKARLDPKHNLWWGLFDFNDEAKTGKNWSYIPAAERAEPWFPRGGTDQICAITEPGKHSSLPSQNGGNFGSSGGMMSFDFNTSLEDAEQAHLQMEASTAPPPEPPAPPAAAPPPPSPPVAEMAAAAIAPPAPAPPAAAAGAPPPPPASASA